MRHRNDKLKGMRGEMHVGAKLDWDKVRYIRANPDRLTDVALAGRFSVSKSTIGQVKQYLTWKEE